MLSPRRRAHRLAVTGVHDAQVEKRAVHSPIPPSCCPARPARPMSRPAGPMERPFTHTSDRGFRCTFSCISRKIFFGRRAPGPCSDVKQVRRRIENSAAAPRLSKRSLGGLFRQPASRYFPALSRAEKSSLCSPQPLPCKGCGGCDPIRGGLPPPRAPLRLCGTSAVSRRFFDKLKAGSEYPAFFRWPKRRGTHRMLQRGA